MSMADYREQFPQYNDLSDGELSKALHLKYGDGRSIEEFNAKMGVQTPLQKAREVGLQPTGEDVRSLSSTVQEPAPGFAEGVARSAVQGGTFGFGDEIISNVAAGFKSFGQATGLVQDDGQSFPESRDQILNRERSKQRQFAEENPVTDIGTTIVGSVPTLALWAARATPLVAGAVGGTLFGAGTGEGGLENRAKSAAFGGALALGAGAAIGKATNAITNKLAERAATRVTAQEAPTINALRDFATKLYSDAKSAGIVVKLEKIQAFSDDIAKKLNESGFHPSLHPNVAAVLSNIRQGGQASFSDIEILRRIAQSSGSAGNRDEGRLARMVVDKIDDLVDGLGSGDLVSGASQVSRASGQLRTARKTWARVRKADEIEDIVEAAKDQASGFENGIRIGIRQLLKSSKRSRFYTDAEKDILRKVVRGSKSANMLKLLGKLSFGRGQASGFLGGSIGVGAGATIAGPFGAVAAPLIGAAARRGSEKATLKATQRASEFIRAGDGAATPATRAVTGVKASVPAIAVSRAAIEALPPPTSPSGTRTPVEAINVAQSVIGADGALLTRFAEIESSMGQNLNASTSSASGLFQFTNGTWKRSVKKWGRKYGIKLSDKANHTAQALIVTELIAENREGLKRAGLGEPTNGDLYIAHFMGLNGARKLIRGAQRHPSQNAAKVFPNAARANKQIFFNERGRARSLGEVYRVLNEKVGL